MKQDTNTNKNDFSISKINRIISKMNKTSIILLVVAYIAILGIILSTIGKDINYIDEPNYEHVFYHNEITPQISLVGVRSETDDVMNLRYNVRVNIAGRLIDNTDPEYKISSFRMFASTKAKLTDKNPNNTYYFTEQTKYSTTVTHSYTIDNSEKGQHPSSFYVRLQYVNNGETKLATFKEEVFLTPSTQDIQGMENWYQNNVDSKPSATAITGIKDSNKTLGNFQVMAYEEKDDTGKNTGIIKSGVKITLTDKDISKFHIDMQSWIVTESGEYLPFIGVYNYTGYSKKYTNSTSDINMKLKPKYIAAKIVYKDQNNLEENTCYFMQEISDLKETFPTDPVLGVDAGVTTNNNRVLYISIAVVGSFAFAVLVVGTVYIIIKKKETE